MPRLTVKMVNKAIADRGHSEELVKGNGYWYFAEGNAHLWPATSVYVYSLNDLTLEGWLEEHAQLAARSH